MMMLHNQDEIAEFDQQLAGIHNGLDTQPNSGIFESVRALMANLFWHDVTEWNQRRGAWSVPDFAFEAFDSDDAEYVRKVVASCVTILKSNGRKGIPALHEAGAAYLRNRGIEAKNIPSRTYSKPLRFGTWHHLFVKANYSENTSERSFRTWLKQQLGADVARRKSKNSQISFCVEFLKEQGVSVPE